MGKINLANLKKTAYYLKRNGLKNTFYAMRERLDGTGQPEYQPIFLSEAEVEAQKTRAAEGFSKLKFSILVPLYHTPEPFLREMIESVQQQTYSRWELILADASENDSIRGIVDRYGDERLRYFKLEKNAGIAENTNCGLEFAEGDYVGLLDHDDVLTADALYEMADRIEKAKKQGIEPGLLYSDEDKCNGDRTEYYEPNIKENFNLDLFLSNNYICHFMMIERSLIQKLKLRKEYDGAQDFDLALRAVFELDGQEERIIHIPRVLYHWRCHSSSTAENPQSKLYAYEAGKCAVQDFVNRKGWAATVEDTEHLGFYRLRYQGDIFEIRPEIGAVGGSVIRRGKILGGRMDEAGKPVYGGLPVTYSGYLHRAVLQQEAEALDIRNIRIRKELQELYEKEIPGVDLNSAADTAEDAIDASRRLSSAVRAAGYKLLYLPEMRK